MLRILRRLGHLLPKKPSRKLEGLRIRILTPWNREEADRPDVFDLVSKALERRGASVLQVVESNRRKPGEVWDYSFEIWTLDYWPPRFPIPKIKMILDVWPNELVREFIQIGNWDAQSFAKSAANWIEGMIVLSPDLKPQHEKQSVK